LAPGLPDGIFSNQKSEFWHIFEGLVLENVGEFYDYLVYLLNFIAIWYIFGHLGYLVSCTEKNLATLQFAS
jgi:hypothetical protein